MNLAPLEVSEADATAALAEYETRLANERTAEDEAIVAAYRAAKRGHQVIRLTDAIRRGGFFEDSNRPRIAIARADARTCWVHGHSADLIFSSERSADNRGALVGRATVRVPGVAESGWLRGASTIVPIIPPRHRPNRRRLHHFHILWEVESWTPEPPRDPALMRHIRGDLWSVLATWDLTDIERAVLAGRTGR